MTDVRSTPITSPTRWVADPPPLLRWTWLCAAAETIGMAASPAAARIADNAVGGGPLATSVAIGALAIVVAGGLVEGVALGFAQARGLTAWLRDRRPHWIVVTVVIAGIGWAAASAPAVLSGDGGDGEPARFVMLVSAAGLGLAMGALLGVVQALVLRGRVPHPWRWIHGSALGWMVAMPVVFLGAGLPGAQWPLVAVVATGAATGLVAGAVLGLISGLLLPSLVGAGAASRFVLALLTSPAHRLLGRSLVGLRLRGAVTGRPISLPAMYARDGSTLVVLPGRPDRKRWWRNLRRAADLTVFVSGHWSPAVGVVLRPGRPGYDRARGVYLGRWPRVRIDPDAPLVRVTVTG